MSISDYIMTSYKCCKCKISNDIEFIEMFVCYICRNIICCNCSHYHNIINNGETEDLKQIVENKQQLFITSCDLVTNFHRFKDNMVNLLDNRNEYEELRNIRSVYLMVEWNERYEYKYFALIIKKIKGRFLFELYKMLLHRKFINDITSLIMEFF